MRRQREKFRLAKRREPGANTLLISGMETDALRLRSFGFGGRMHEPVAQVGEWLKRVLQGFYQYHAIPGNQRSLNKFRERLSRHWRHTLNRRSQQGRVGQDRATRLFDRWLPRPCVLHPYPDARFDATHPR